MVKAVLHIGKDGGGDPLWVIFGEVDFTILNRIVASKSPLLLLFGVEEVIYGVGRVGLITIDQKRSVKHE